MALSSTAGSGLPVGYEQDGPPQMQLQRQRQQQQQGAGGYSSTSAVSQLFARLSQEIEEKQPKNCIHFIVDFLCKHYPEHLHGFASIWQMDPDLERERHEVVNFFKAHKISTAVAAHFTNAGYDTLDTLTTLSPDSLVDVEAFNNVKWLPGHKVRLQQIFGEISARVRAYRQQMEQPPPQAHHSRHHHSQHHSKAASPARAAAPSAHIAHQASPYLGQHAALAGHAGHAAALAGHGPAALHPAAVYGLAPALAAHPTALSAGIGHGLMAPALSAPGNLFGGYSPYPMA